MRGIFKALLGSAHSAENKTLCMDLQVLCTKTDLSFLKKTLIFESLLFTNTVESTHKAYPPANRGLLKFSLALLSSGEPSARVRPSWQ